MKRWTTLKRRTTYGSSWLSKEERKMSICDTCILNGGCDGRCGDTDPLFYAFEEENDRYNTSEDTEE